MLYPDQKTDDITDEKKSSSCFKPQLIFPLQYESIPLITFSDIQEQTFLWGWLQYCLHYPNLQNLSYWPSHVHQIQADFGQLMSTETEHCNAKSYSWQSRMISRGLQNKSTTDIKVLQLLKQQYYWHHKVLLTIHQKLMLCIRFYYISVTKM